MRSALISLSALAVLLLSSSTGAAEESLISFNSSMNLLDVELQIRVLNRFQRWGFYIAPELAESYLERQRALAEELDRAALDYLESIDAWRAEAVKVEAAEKETMEKVAETWMIKMLKAATTESDEQQGASSLIAARREQLSEAIRNRNEMSKAAAEVKYLEDLTRSLENRLHGKKAITDGWRAAVRNTFRLKKGLYAKRADLHSEIVFFENQRVRAEAALESIKWVNKWTTRVERLRDPTAMIQEKGEEAVLEYLKKRFPEKSVSKAKAFFDDARKIIGSVKAIRDEVRAIGDDPSLQAYPETVKMAQRFAVSSTLFRNAIENLKRHRAGSMLKPVLDVLGFFAEATGLVSTCARKVGAVMHEQRQREFGMEWNSVWNDICNNYGYTPPIPPSELMEATEGNIQVTSNLNQKRDADLYYLAVSTIPRGYATLNVERYERLCNAVSAERIISATKAASDVGLWESRSFLWKDGVAAMFGGGDGSLFSRANAQAFQKALKDNSKKTGFSHEQLLDLAMGEAVDYQGGKWTAERLVREAEGTIARLAHRFAVGDAIALGADQTKWFAFRKVLAEHGVPLTTQQTLNIFREYATGGSEAVEQTLERLARERAVSRLGVPQVGIPLVTIPNANPMFVDTIDKAATIEATIITSDLAPERQVAADVTWALPSWAEGQSKPQRIQLGNGLQKVRHTINVPPGVEDESFTVKVVVGIAPDETHEDPITAEATGIFDIEEMAVEWVQKRHMEYLGAVAFSPGGSILASADIAQPSRKSLLLWNAADGTLLRELEGGKNAIYSSDGQFLFTLVKGHSNEYRDFLLVYSTEDYEVHERMSSATPAQIVELALGNTILASHESRFDDVDDDEKYDSNVVLWDVRDGRPKRLRTMAFTRSSWRSGVAVSSDDQYVAAYGAVRPGENNRDQDGKVWIWRTSGAAHKEIRFQALQADSIEFSPDGKTLAVCLNIDYEEYETRLIDVASGSVRARLKTGPKTGANAIAFSPGGRLLAAGGYDAIIRIWALPEGRIVHQFRPEGNLEDCDVLALDFSPDGRSLASGHRDMSVRMWLLTDSLFAP